MSKNGVSISTYGQPFQCHLFPCWNNLSIKPLQGPHTPRQTARNDATVPGRGRSAPDVEDDRFPAWGEKSLKKRANIMEMTVPSWKDAMRPGSDARINPENVNRSLRSTRRMELAGNYRAFRGRAAGRKPSGWLPRKFPIASVAWLK